MSFRTVVITKRTKLNYKQGYLIVRNEELKKIFLDEIDTIIIDTLMASISSYLLMEIAQRNIKLIYCDIEHNPVSELVPLYGSHNTSKKMIIQSNWTEKGKNLVWQKVIKQKIKNQSYVLRRLECLNGERLEKYAVEVRIGDNTNREGHAAKVYFTSLFGKDFSRSIQNDINAALDYGYSILLSTFNKEIVRIGNATQLGIHHKNEFNPYNLSCDLMEPFRPIVDFYVSSNPEPFDSFYKYNLVNLLNEQYEFEEKQYYLKDIIRFYTKKVSDCLNSPDNIKMPEFLL